MWYPYITMYAIHLFHSRQILWCTYLDRSPFLAPSFSTNTQTLSYMCLTLLSSAATLRALALLDNSVKHIIRNIVTEVRRTCACACVCMCLIESLDQTPIGDGGITSNHYTKLNNIRYKHGASQKENSGPCYCLIMCPYSKLVHIGKCLRLRSPNRQ